MTISAAAKEIMLDVERRSMDPLQRIILQTSRSSREQASMQECFMGRLSEKPLGHYVGKNIVFMVAELLKTIHVAGVELTLEIYYSYRAEVRLIEAGEITTGFREVQRVADSMPDDDIQAQELLSSIIPNIKHLTWNNLVELGKLTEEYNVEWALASYEWERGVAR